MAARFLPTAEKLARFAMNRRGLASRFVDVAGVRLHVYDGRGGGTLPPLVLLHGLGSGGAAFAGLVRHLTPHVGRIIIPELPGHGFSTRGDRAITPELLLEAIAGAIDVVLDEPAIVYGSSLGGGIAIKYALEHPAKVRALVLVSPAGAPLPDDEWKALVKTFHVEGRHEARAFLERLYHRPPWFLALLAREFPDVLARPAVREILESATQAHAPSPEDLGRLSMPLLFLWGRSEKLLPASALRYFRAHLPAHAVIEEPEGFGHTPQLEVPGRLAERVLAFLHKLDLAVRPSRSAG
ncbi:MAG: putative 2-hydroxy-6-oxohepta-2,4-dienoate hydrolase [Myxococcaceae bacterium]|nr:putative 2-hydroxy-6-oxohepta-2,4-dienoate hydrolase [Myxococcaceae bacterium]